MHELSIASSLVEKLLDFADKNPDKKIVEVRLAVGELSHIEGEQLNFCYDSIIAETPLAESTLYIEKSEAVVECPHCSYRGRPKYWEEALSDRAIATLQCPVCSKSASAVEGNECEIRSIKYREVTDSAFTQ